MKRRHLIAAGGLAGAGSWAGGPRRCGARASSAAGSTSTLAWLGHATVLIDFYGVGILTDPVLFRRIGVAIGPTSIGPLRLIDVRPAADDLPEIDLGSTCSP